MRQRSQESVVAAYWKPVYKYVRLRWNASNADAQDLTQAFFAHVIEGSTLMGYDPGKGTFRTYLRTCLDGFVLNERTRAARLKRGGGSQLLTLDFDVPATQDLDEFFHREWVRSVFTLALEELRRDCASRGKDLQLRIFEAYDLADDGRRPTYDDLAREHGVTSATVTNYLAAMRRELRKAVLAKLRDLTATEREFRTEARAILGIEV